MNARLAASSAPRSVGYAPTRWPATVRSPSRPASCARTSATGARNNATRTIWITVKAAPRRAAVVRRHAARWPPNECTFKGSRSTSSREYIELGSPYPFHNLPGRHTGRASRQISTSSVSGSREDFHSNDRSSQTRGLHFPRNIRAAILNCQTDRRRLPAQLNLYSRIRGCVPYRIGQQVGDCALKKNPVGLHVRIALYFDTEATLGGDHVDEVNYRVTQTTSPPLRVQCAPERACRQSTATAS